MAWADRSSSCCVSAACRYWRWRITTTTAPMSCVRSALARAGLGPYVDEHLLTVARLHRENRYDRVTTTVEDVTGRPAESVEEFIARQKDLFTK